MKPFDPSGAQLEQADFEDDDGPAVGLLDLATWLGQGKAIIVGITAAAALLSAGVALLLPDEYTARVTMLPPVSQQPSGNAAALAALGALGGLSNVGGLSAKTPEEMYVALLKSDGLQRALDQRFDLKTRWDVQTYEQLRKAFPNNVRITADKKSGVITVEATDEDPKFAADLANAYTNEITKVLGRLAVSEAQQRRVFFEQQLKDTKENLNQAEQALRVVQEKSGVIVLDKQAEALIRGAAELRALIAEREVQLKVMRTGATEQNPDVQRIGSELRALRAELARMESRQGGTSGSAIDIPVGALPAVGIDYVRARRELKVQETILESMIRQFEIAKLDEAKEGPVLQTVDRALPPDRKSGPQRGLIVLASSLLALIVTCGWVALRRYNALARELDPNRARAWQAFSRAWRWRAK